MIESHLVAHISLNNDTSLQGENTTITLSAILHESQHNVYRKMQEH